VTPQALGQALFGVGLLAWGVAWIGLVVVGWVAAVNRQPFAAPTASLLASVICTAGIAAMYNAPGSVQ